MLEEAGTSYLDTIYEQILNTSFPNPTASESMTLCSVLGTIILAKASLSRLAIAHLLSLKVSTVERICTGLRSLVRSEETLGFYHESFVDFLIDPRRSTSTFFITRQHESRVLTRACLRTMKENLRFNICGLESSHKVNADAPDLLSREKKYIPRHLSYSCSWWANHLAETSFDEEIFRDLEYFMQKQFLFWLEVLSILKRVNIGSQALTLVVTWILVRFSLSHIADKLKHITSLMAKLMRLPWQKTCKNLLLHLPAAYHRAPLTFTYQPYHSRLEGQLCGFITCKAIHGRSESRMVD